MALWFPGTDFLSGDLSPSSSLSSVVIIVGCLLVTCLGPEPSQPSSLLYSNPGQLTLSSLPGQGLRWTGFCGS